ncbi:ATP-binding cassette subfamily B protein RaxB [Vogesella perlucida]|nr:ATP-binding cassette subfamily B protein RaxB [Vogesella perlucida]
MLSSRHLGQRKLPVLLQSEAAECGLACLAMVASFHGYRSDLLTLRCRFSTSLKGMSLVDMVSIADTLGLAGRAFRLEPDEMRELVLPCVLHWNMNHFVVLAKVHRKGITVHDPAHGFRQIEWSEVDKAFTGIALELTPTPAFRKAEIKQNIPLRGLLKDIPSLWHVAWQIFMLALILEILSILSPMLTQWMIDGVLVSADRELLKVLVIGSVALVIINVVISSLRSWAVLHLSTTLGLNWTMRVFSHLIRLPVSYFEKRHIGDISSRFHSVGNIQNTLTNYFIETVLDGLLAIGTFILMLIYSPILTVIAVSGLFLYTLMRWLWFDYIKEKTEQQLILAAKRDSHFLETLRGIQAIKLFSNETQRRQNWLNLLVDETNANVEVAKNGIIYRVANTLFTGLENAAVLWFGASLVLDNVFSVGMYMAFASYNAQFSGRMISLIDKAVSLRMLRLQTERLADILLTEQEPQPSLIAPQPRNGSVTFRNIWFRYADNEPWVCQGLSFSVKEGESIAIIGPSGCGKSTVLKLLLGIYQPQQGDILLGDIPLAQLGSSTGRELCATVMQNDILFAGSLADNIAFFDQSPDRERIVHCARLAAIHDDIVAMPMGFETLVGDMGSALSGGQKQRVLLARALYRQPRILLLDEATSHLDTHREAEVNMAIAQLQLTRIIVAHRPETIASADRVIDLTPTKQTA